MTNMTPEALARVLHDSCPASQLSSEPWHFLHERERGYWIEIARAALAALTPAPTECAACGTRHHSIYRSVCPVCEKINAALTPTPTPQMFCSHCNKFVDPEGHRWTCEK